MYLGSTGLLGSFVLFQETCVVSNHLRTLCCVLSRGSGVRCCLNICSVTISGKTPKYKNNLNPLNVAQVLGIHTSWVETLNPQPQSLFPNSALCTVW